MEDRERGAAEEDMAWGEASDNILATSCRVVCGGGAMYSCGGV